LHAWDRNIWVFIRTIEDEMKEILWEWKLGFQIGEKRRKNQVWGINLSR